MGLLNYSKVNKEIAGGCCIGWRENREFNQCISSTVFKYVGAIKQI